MKGVSRMLIQLRNLEWSSFAPKREGPVKSCKGFVGNQRNLVVDSKSQVLETLFYFRPPVIILHARINSG